jgi:hypothetical protein
MDNSSSIVYYQLYVQNLEFGVELSRLSSLTDLESSGLPLRSRSPIVWDSLRIKEAHKPSHHVKLQSVERGSTSSVNYTTYFTLHLKLILMRRPWLDPRSIYMGFVVDKAALGQILLRDFSFLLLVSFYRAPYPYIVF